MTQPDRRAPDEYATVFAIKLLPCLVFAFRRELAGRGSSWILGTSRTGCPLVGGVFGDGGGWVPGHSLTGRGWAFAILVWCCGGRGWVVLADAPELLELFLVVSYRRL